MVLDDEKQRSILLAILANVPIQGSLQQVKEAVNQLETLMNSVISASIIPNE